MLDVSIVNETSSEANWNRQTDRQTDGQTGKPMCREAAPPKIFEKEGKVYIFEYHIMLFYIMEDKVNNKR